MTLRSRLSAFFFSYKYEERAFVPPSVQHEFNLKPDV